jgi:2-keto-4-pentenoate hydratase
LKVEFVTEAADRLWQAAHSGQPIAPLRETYPGLDETQAYAIQQHNTARQVAQGARLVGRKIGLTSVAVQRQLGVDQPDYGALFEHMAWLDGEPIAWQRLQQPKVEAEVALVLERDLPEPRIALPQLLRAVAFALPAIEVVGSRIAEWNIRFVDTVADNASSGGFVLGTRPVKLESLDLRLLGMAIRRRGEPVSLGAGAACLGNPLHAALWLANKLAAMGQGLRAGDVVLTGALGPMVVARPGDCFEARIHGLGTVSAHFGGLA